MDVKKKLHSEYANFLAKIYTAQLADLANIFSVKQENMGTQWGSRKQENLQDSIPPMTVSANVHLQKYQYILQSPWPKFGQKILKLFLLQKVLKMRNLLDERKYD